ncbi:MAG TPA: translation initiation factor IF-3 [Candidatus Polarisedimenticolia bacterium]|nr:translation initiation factor IF-3 [Candidatus Polarisedimenticolia bacterium]
MDIESIHKKTRVNEKIRAKEIRVIGSSGGQLGIMTPEAALKMAEEEGLDLVEVAPEAAPPVCRIMDFGKYRYQLNKKAQESRKKQKQIVVKEVKFRPKTEEHDYQFKKNNISRFISKENKVKVSVMFRGRENQHREIGQRILDRIRTELEEVAVVESGPRLEGPLLYMMMAPKR